MEFVDGKTLKQIDNSLLDSTNVLQMLYQVLLVIERLQGLKICHNDLNGSNVMLTRQGELKVIDFGQSKAMMLGKRERAFSKNSKSTPEGQQAFKWTENCRDPLKFKGLVKTLIGWLIIYVACLLLFHCYLFLDRVKNPSKRLEQVSTLAEKFSLGKISLSSLLHDDAFKDVKNLGHIITGISKRK